MMMTADCCCQGQGKWLIRVMFFLQNLGFWTRHCCGKAGPSDLVCFTQLFPLSLKRRDWMRRSVRVVVGSRLLCQQQNLHLSCKLTSL